VTALTLRVMRLMLDKRRETEIPGLRAEFARLRRERGQVLYAQVTSSVELTDAQKSNLVSKLEAKSGKRVEAEYRLDSSLMGGIKVALGNYVLDGSIKGSLGRLRDTLRRDLLKQG
jgi:F-type H+-transporting ATPase subunit delta